MHYLLMTASVQGRRSFPQILKTGEPNLLVVNSGKCHECQVLQLYDNEFDPDLFSLKN